jgi:hypothetical protein
LTVDVLVFRSYAPSPPAFAFAMSGTPTLPSSFALILKVPSAVRVVLCSIV